eukprot:g74828.t1
MFSLVPAPSPSLHQHQPYRTAAQTHPPSLTQPWCTQQLLLTAPTLPYLTTRPQPVPLVVVHTLQPTLARRHTYSAGLLPQTATNGLSPRHTPHRLTPSPRPAPTATTAPNASSILCPTIPAPTLHMSSPSKPLPLLSTTPLFLRPS